MADLHLSRRVNSLFLLGTLLLLATAITDARDLQKHHRRCKGKRSIFKDKECVHTPKQFVEAFLKRENRCVSSNILVRLQSDNGKGGAPQARNLFASRLNARPVTFFSYDDTPDKYLSFGVPMALGDYGGDPSENGDADATFDGLDSLSNFLGLLAQVGYDAPNSFISGTYAMIVTTKPKQLPLDKSFVPTWANVVAYFNRYLAWVAEDQAFKLPEQIVKHLAHKTFAQLTKCPTTCTYDDLEFPGPSAPRPAIIGKRIGPTECENPNATRYELTEPTGFDDQDASCSALWKEAKAFADQQCTNGSDLATVKLAGAALVEKLQELPEIKQQTMYFRAYLNTACGGTFNTLFSGNGYTYTGTGGLLAPLGKEMLLGASPHLDKDNDISSLDEVEYLYFCSDGKYSRDPDFKCPTSA